MCARGSLGGGRLPEAARLLPPLPLPGALASGMVSCWSCTGQRLLPLVPRAAAVADAKGEVAPAWLRPGCR